MEPVSWTLEGYARGAPHSQNRLLPEPGLVCIHDAVDSGIVDLAAFVDHVQDVRGLANDGPGFRLPLARRLPHGETSRKFRRDDLVDEPSPIVRRDLAIGLGCAEVQILGDHRLLSARTGLWIEAGARTHERDARHQEKRATT